MCLYWGTGIDNGNFNVASQLISGRVATASPLSPSAINNNGEVAGAAAVYNDLHATTYQNGQLTDLSSKVGPEGYISQAVAINQHGDLIDHAMGQAMLADRYPFFYHGCTSDGPAGHPTQSRAIPDHCRVRSTQQ